MYNSIEEVPIYPPMFSKADIEQADSYGYTRGYTEGYAAGLAAGQREDKDGLDRGILLSFWFFYRLCSSRLAIPEACSFGVMKRRGQHSEYICGGRSGRSCSELV